MMMILILVIVGIQGAKIGMMVVGTTGDVNPMLAVAIKLKNDGHDVRFSTQFNFKNQIEHYGLEFYPLAGDAKALAEYAVSIKGRLFPKSVAEYHRMRGMIPITKETIFSTWKAMTDNFQPDMIVANPACFGAFHVAEKLQVPLHYMFSVPWMKTAAFPHILASSLKALRQERKRKNRLSYSKVTRVLWIGLRGIINDFRQSLSLSKIHYKQFKAAREAPHSFLFSKYLLPKPADWGNHVRVVGTARLPHEETVATFNASSELEKFLFQGPAPVFIGFGSMMIPSPKRFFEQVLQAAEATNTKVLIQNG